MPKSSRDEYDSELGYFLHKIKPLRIIGLILVIIVGITAFTGITVVDSTERAVVFHKNNGSLSILGPGYHYIVPIIQSATKYDVRETTYTESAIGISLDLQETTTEVTVRYQPDPSSIQTIHQTLGTNYQTKVVVPAVQQCVKNAVSNYNVEQLTGAVRAQVNEKIAECIENDLKTPNLLVTKVSVTDFDFSVSFNDAIEAKAIAQQKAQEEKNRLEQVKYQANQTIVQAQAQAEAVRLLAEASTSGDTQSQAYLFLEWLKVWDGVLPTVMSGESGSSLLITPPSTNQS
jgi:prohibitin 2